MSLTRRLRRPSTRSSPQPTRTLRASCFPTRSTCCHGRTCVPVALPAPSAFFLSVAVGPPLAPRSVLHGAALVSRLRRSGHVGDPPPLWPSFRPLFAPAWADLLDRRCEQSVSRLAERCEWRADGANQDDDPLQGGPSERGGPRCVPVSLCLTSRRSGSFSTAIACALTTKRTSSASCSSLRRRCSLCVPVHSGGSRAQLGFEPIYPYLLDLVLL